MSKQPGAIQQAEMGAARTMIDTTEERFGMNPAVTAGWSSQAHSADGPPAARMGRLRLCGPCRARDEFLLAATAQNLRKLAKLAMLPKPEMTPAA
jgi:hypothetical protein